MNFLSNQNATNALGVVSKFTQPWKLKANPNSSLYIYTHIFPSFGGTLISERRGREEKEGAIWFGFRRRVWSFFFFEEMDTTSRVERGWGEEMGLRTISPNEYSCSGSRLRFSATLDEISCPILHRRASLAVSIRKNR